MRKINVEQLSEVTFRQWTDGGKWVLDTQGIQIHYPYDARHYTGKFEDMMAFLTSNGTPIATYFFVGYIQEFCKLLDTFPTFNFVFMFV